MRVLKLSAKVGPVGVAKQKMFRAGGRVPENSPSKEPPVFSPSFGRVGVAEPSVWTATGGIILRASFGHLSGILRVSVFLRNRVFSY